MRAWFSISLILCTAVFGVLALAQSNGRLRGPIQPLPFSHKTHAGTLSLECKTCHINPDPGELMTFAANATCMQCHVAVKTDSPHIQELAKAAEEDRAIQWVRVYQIPGFVYFNHRTHLESGATCEQCHGAVPTRERIFLDGDITMAGCMNCHVENSASIDCSYCHDPL